MTGPNTDGGEQFGDYDEAEYNRQMMVAEIKVQAAAIEHLRAENEKLRELVKGVLYPSGQVTQQWVDSAGKLLGRE